MLGSAAFLDVCLVMLKGLLECMSGCGRSNIDSDDDVLGFSMNKLGKTRHYPTKIFNPIDSHSFIGAITITTNAKSSNE